MSAKQPESVSRTTKDVNRGFSSFASRVLITLCVGQEQGQGRSHKPAKELTQVAQRGKQGMLRLASPLSLIQFNHGACITELACLVLPFSIGSSPNCLLVVV